MSDQTNCILNEIPEGKEFIKAHTLHFKSFKKNIRRSEKLRQRNVDKNKSSTIQQNNKIIIFFNQQFRNAETMILRLQNLQRARLLE